MLKFRLATGVAPNQWRWNEHWKAGESYVVPYRHPSLEHAAFTDGKSTFLVVRERQSIGSLGVSGDHFVRLDSQTYRAQLDDANAWPLDFVLIEHDMRGAYRVTSGQWGTAPIYVTDKDRALYGSWSLSDLHRHLRNAALNERAVARALTQRLRYTRDTLFEGTFQLTERSHADYTQDGLVLHYPAPAVRARPRPIRPGVDVVSVYTRTLGDAIAEREYDPDESAVELSGGIDSANVAMSLAEQHPSRLLAYALLVGGEAGEQQVSRRNEMLEYINFRNLTVDALDFSPLHPLGARARGEFVDPLAESFHEAVAQMLNAARAAGVRTVFTGDGGDELLGLRGDEWVTLGKVPGRHAPNRELPPWMGARAHEAMAAIDDDVAPPTVINEATLLGFASRSPQFLGAGLWPVSPMCSPSLIRFAEQLPLDWRANKKISRVRLARLGFAAHISQPPLQENFRHVMVHGLRTYGMTWLGKFLDNSILVDLGFVDADELRQAYKRITSTGSVESLIFQYLVLELALQAIEQKSGSGQCT